MDGIECSVVPTLALLDMTSLNQSADSTLDRALGLPELLDEVSDGGPRLAVLRHEGEANQHGAFVLIQARNVVCVPNKIEPIPHHRNGHDRGWRDLRC